MSATPLPVSIALAGHTNDRLLRNVSATSRIAQVRIDGEDLRHADLEAQPDLPQDVDRDDDGGHVQPRIADVRQDHGVRAPAERERPAGHIVSRNGLVRRPHSTTVVAAQSDVWFNPSRARRAGPRRRRTGRATHRRWRSRWALVGVRSRWRWSASGIALVLPAWRSGRSAAAAGEPPRFVDETTAAGIDHTYDGEFEFFVGGGVAAFDCDDDGRAELFFAGGSEPAALYRNESAVGGALRFARQASPVTDLTAVTGAYPLDIDSDGHVDLAVLRRGGNVVLRGRGDCRFEDANELLGIDGGDAWTAAFSATWEGSNALPTLAFGNYLVPDRERCDDSQLVRPAADGRRVRLAHRAQPRVLHAVDAVQRLEPVRPARPAHVERPALLPRRRGAAVADRARRGATRSTPRPTDGARCRSGAWASPVRT